MGLTTDSIFQKRTIIETIQYKTQRKSIFSMKRALVSCGTMYRRTKVRTTANFLSETMQPEDSVGASLLYSKAKKKNVKEKEMVNLESVPIKIAFKNNDEGKTFQTHIN